MLMYIQRRPRTRRNHQWPLSTTTLMTHPEPWSGPREAFGNRGDKISSKHGLSSAVSDIARAAYLPFPLLPDPFIPLGSAGWAGGIGGFGLFEG